MSATITAEQVKALRERTNAAMMDCKKALIENDGDADKAVEWLRKKGITKSEGKAGREVKEGVIASYIHMQGKVGVLVEINCETDFVAKNDIFKDFVKDITLHIAAANPTYLNRDQVPAQKVESERDIAKAQIVGKPEAVIEKILVGKIEKYYIENCLLDQGFIKNPDISIATLIKTKISELGENIVIRRFARYQVGEAL